MSHVMRASLQVGESSSLCRYNNYISVFDAIHQAMVRNLSMKEEDLLLQFVG